MDNTTKGGRLSLLAAALVVARRDFMAVLWSRSFIFFLIGPLFPLVVGAMAGSVTSHVDNTASEVPRIGVMMERADLHAVMIAANAIGPTMDGALPDLSEVRQQKPGDPAAALRREQAANHDIGAILSGTLDRPVLTGPHDRIEEWRGPIALLIAHARTADAGALPGIKLSATAAAAPSRPETGHGRALTAQAAQTLLFLLMMLLAGMVLSNLVEEKGNKIIEVLAAAIPMDAVFLGKLFAMLAVSLVGIAVWGAAGGAMHLASGQSLHFLTAPAVGWPMFIALGIAYFAMGYLLLGSVFLTIGSMASTVREVQTLNMPVTMAQILVFFFASYGMAREGSPVEWAAMIFPFSSPFAMLGRAALHADLWPHLAALGWQALCVLIFVRAGAHIFRRRVMQSGGVQGAVKKRRGIFGKKV
ncbi:ABC transporter permease [Novosphingobium terrae]|uniref:ABC transporter permease n=1 Tax=Novosphingobium terrae TaxID=2726189 RepID=UPI001981E393|nr:ABC transporter permease [Novosphingobium terrae]